MYSCLTIQFWGLPSVGLLWPSLDKRSQENTNDLLSLPMPRLWWWRQRRGWRISKQPSTRREMRFSWDLMGNFHNHSSLATQITNKICGGWTKNHSKETKHFSGQTKYHWKPKVKVQEQIRINLEERLQKLEVSSKLSLLLELGSVTNYKFPTQEEALRVPQAPPPPPPPPPQKSFLSSLAKPFKVRGRKASKQEQTTQAKGELEKVRLITTWQR